MNVSMQWKNFNPLSKEFREAYIARLDALIKRTGDQSETIASIKPILVSIERLDLNSYSVISIRTYESKEGGPKTATTNVDAAAVVLRGQNLIRLTIIRPLINPSDVAEVKGEMAEWARAMEVSQR